MTTETANKPLWLAIEEQIHGAPDADFSDANAEQAIRRLAQSLDGEGFNVSRHAGNMLELRRAVSERCRVGRALLGDFNEAVDGLTLTDVEDTYIATVNMSTDLGEVWPALAEAARRPDILAIVDARKLDLQVAEAQTMDGDKAARYLISNGIPSETILERLSIDQATLDAVHAALAAEAAARARVEALLKEVADASDVDKARHLITNDIPENDIVDLAGLDPEAITEANTQMEAEIAEKKRLAEEEAARKKAEAEGPSLEDIPNDELIEYLESVQEIMEFTEEEAEIRQMCEQSSIPKCIVDIAVNDPDRIESMLDEAEG